MTGRARLRVTLLGTFQASRGDDVVMVPGARLQALLVRLALAGGRAVDASALVAAIWAEDPPAAPAHALQSLVSRLRRVLGSAGDVAQVAGGYRLDVDPGEVDALRFEQLAAAGRERLRAGDGEAAVALLQEAVDLWPDQPGAEPAAVVAVAPAAATRLATASIEAVVDLAGAQLSLGRAEPAGDRLTALFAEQPVNERVAGLLMDALAAQGRQAEALALYERVREHVADSLGSDPGTALRERHLRLLRVEPPAAPTDPIAPAAPTAPTAPIDPVDPALSRSSTLPAPLTSFIGRHDDLARVEMLLAGGRLVTVLGPGGAGKTRLAIEAARRRHPEYRDGAWMIDLSSVTEPTKIATAVLAGIGRRSGAIFEARQRVEGGEWDVLVEQLAGRECLLLVDNCEHLIDAVAHLVTALLSRCPGLRVLATSREPLAVDGEALVPLAPLALPDPDADVEQARRTASVRLFTERAAAVRPGFDVDKTTLSDVVRVVRGLDGLPLALELAAARLRTLSLPELADGLSDRFRLLTTGSRTAPPRHRTLRAVIAWSWEPLGEHESTVAQRISVLPGGITPASATAVCADTTVPAAEIPDLLAALVDRSLLQLAPDTGRYRMLETIREYGLEHLIGAGALDTTRDLAAAHFTDLMTHHDSRLRGPDQLSAMKAISAEYDNTLAALRHLCTTHDSSGAITLSATLAWYWQMFGRHHDAAYWLGEALAIPGGAQTPERDCARAAHLLNRADILSGITAGEAADDRVEMRELANRLLTHPELPSHHRVIGPVLLFLQQDQSALQAFHLLADGDDVWLSGLAHMFLAEIAENTGAFDRTRIHVESSLTHFRKAGDRWGQTATLPMRAQLRRYDDLDGALADLQEAQSLATEFGPPSPGDQLYSDLRWIDVHMRRDDTAQALALLTSARERALHASSTELLILINAHEADLHVRNGDLPRAAALLDAAEQGLRTDTAFPADHARTLVCGTRSALRLALNDLSGADEALREVHTAALATGELPILSQATVHAAALAEARGHHHETAVLLGTASRLRGTHDRTDPRVRELVRRARAAMGGEAFDSAYEQGWELDANTATSLASGMLGTVKR